MVFKRHIVYKTLSLVGLFDGLLYRPTRYIRNSFVRRTSGAWNTKCFSEVDCWV